jgi:lauroyl/myristoyl acyltransferase/lipopolysaccharide biosynthesis glycosyltransferase
VRDVAFSCDDGGSDFLRVAVWSLLDRYDGDEPIRVNVFEGFGGHSAAHKAALAEVVARFPKATLRYHDVEPYLKPYPDIVKGRENSRWNVFTWTPIFTPQILADAEGNVVHFDIDMLFNADVTPLFEMDVDLVACCHEYDRYGENAGRVVWENGILPPEAERYFNTGVLVFNAAACRAERTWEKIVEWYRAHVDVADRIEQDAWNALYWRRTKALPVRWNFHDRNMKGYAKWKLPAKYWLGNPPRECLEASLDPAILHFWGPKKPWKPSHRPYRRLYHEAMRAVGLKAPREQLLAPFFNAANAVNLWRIRRRLALVTLKAAPVRPLKVVKHALLAPFEWLGVLLGVLLLSNLPHRALFAVCDALSAAMYRLDGRGRRIALENLRIVTGVAPARDMAHMFDPKTAKYDPTRREEVVIRGSYRNMARTVGHVFWTLRSARKRVPAVGELSPECTAFLKANRPAVTVSGHIGCWEILSQLAFLAGHRMMSVAKPIGTRGITRLLMRARLSIGQEIVPAKGAFKPLMAGIRAGKSIGLLVDQAVSPLDGGVWVRFFGRPVPVTAAPAFFAAKARASVVVAWSRPLKGGRYRCEMVETVSADEARDVWATTQRCARALERIIRRHPSCWVLNYDAFSYSSLPDGEAELARRERAANLRTAPKM